LRGQASWDIIVFHEPDTCRTGRLDRGFVLRRGRLLDAIRRIGDRHTPAQYSHVWITAQEVWFNTSAIAGPDDGGWVRFPLSTPVTVDLVTESGGKPRAASSPD